jgi:flagellar hook-associated protein 1 FlgK
MSLLSAINLAGNALQIQQLGLQVVGQNIANANTPGYSREQLQLAAQTTGEQNGVLVGLGVQATGVVQVVNQFLNDQYRSATSASTSAQTQQTAYTDLQQAINALGTSNVGTQLNSFVASIQNVLDSPGNSSVQSLAVDQGQALTGTINQLSQSVDQLRTGLDTQVQGDVSSINSLIGQVGQLNTQIMQEEGSLGSRTQAVGLLDQRDEALSQLSNLVNINVEPQPNGSVNVYVGGNYLVSGNLTRTLSTQQTTNGGITVTTPVLADDNSPLAASGGDIAGAIAARDQILGGFQTNLNQFSSTLAYEFNKIYSSGQGTTGYQSLTSTNTVDSPTASLENAGLPFTPVSGGFNIQVTNSQTGTTSSTYIPVSLNGLDSDTSLSSLANSLNQVSGLSASVSADGHLTIGTTSNNLSFAFSNDTSGTLASLGLNTFFTGSTGGDLGVNSVVVNDSSKFAASQGGIGVDTNNAQQLAGFLNQPLESAGGQTISQLNQNLSSNVSQSAAAQKAIASGLSSYQSTLASQQESTSGVSIDEETVSMLSYQQAYQASAKFISVVQGLLQTLMQDV